MTAIEFVMAVLGLFSDTLSAVMNISVFAFYLGFSLLAAAYALFRYFLYTSKSGVK